MITFPIFSFHKLTTTFLYGLKMLTKPSTCKKGSKTQRKMTDEQDDINTKYAKRSTNRNKRLRIFHN